MPGATSPCPFCSPEPERVFLETELVIGLWDGFPVSPGHALLVPRRHVATWFDASADELIGLVQATKAAHELIEQQHRPDGYNIGVNVGEAGGQTVFHLHLHVIPRYRGDVQDPRGGVRWALPQKAAWWSSDR